MTPQELLEKLKKHKDWVEGVEGGERFVAIGAYLRSADLSGAYLSGADLSGADLSGAYLSGADLSGADLSGADLRSAYLSGADLRSAYLRSAYLSGAKNFFFSICPEEGAFTAYKKVYRVEDRTHVVLTLQIPASAKRVSTPLGRKCRAESVKVLKAELMDGTPIKGKSAEFQSGHDRKFIYRIGATLTVENFCDDIRQECRPGLHFYMTKAEASAH